jgi:hypothetical protein
MIKVGQIKKAKYWGEFREKKVAGLKQPVKCHSKEKGDIEFLPTIVQIEWEVSPSMDNNEYRFPYWQKIHDKEKYGQFAPMIGGRVLLELLEDAIRQDFFNRAFLTELSKSIQAKLDSRP